MPLYNLKKVKEAIEEVFSDYFLRYGFKEDENITWNNTYKNAFCTFVFSGEYEGIELHIKQVGDDYDYHIFSVYRYVHGGFFPSREGTADWMQKQLRSYRIFLENDLPELPNGDFSWGKVVKEKEAIANKINAKLFSLDNTHPIYIKYDNDDPTWEDDIKKLLDEE